MHFLFIQPTEIEPIEPIHLLIAVGLILAFIIGNIFYAKHLKKAGKLYKKSEHNENDS